MRIKNFSFLLVFMLIILPGMVKADDAEEIKETVIKLPGAVSRITLDYGLRPNIGISIGNDGLLLVDTGHRSAALKLLEVVNNLGNPVKYIINTHSHGDHAGGNEFFSEDVIIIRYENLLEMVNQGVIYADSFPLVGKSGLQFETSYGLIFNGEEIKIIPYPGVHSNGDLIIYFTGSGVVHMGDLLLSESFPAVGSRVKQYLHILDEIVDIFPPDTIFIAGHGRDFTIEDVKQYKQMIETTIDIVIRNMRDGKSLDEMQADDILNEFKQWGLFLDFLNTDKWIEFIFDSFKKDYQGNIFNLGFRLHLGV